MTSEVFNIDCVEYMRTLEDNVFHLAIVDPPYGINAGKMKMGGHATRKGEFNNSSGPSISTAERLKRGRLNHGNGKLKGRLLNTSNVDWDNESPTEEYWEQLFRVSRDQIIWGGNYFPLPPTRGIVAWNKLQPWENFSQFELAWTSFDTPAKVFSYSNTGGANEEKRIHPTQKPVKLYEYLLDRFAKPNGYTKIFDSHMGSQSSRIAAWNMGLDYFGCELSNDYFDSGCRRFGAHKRQLKLW